MPSAPPLRSAGSGPWQRKQLLERIWRMSRLKSIFSAAIASGTAQRINKMDQGRAAFIIQTLAGGRRRSPAARRAGGFSIADHAREITQKAGREAASIDAGRTVRIRLRTASAVP